MANFTALAAARHELLRRAGWDVEERGPAAARRACASSSATKCTSRSVGALRLLGFGTDEIVRVAADDQGRMRPDALRRGAAPACDGPTIVCAQAGNVNTGAFDPIDAIADSAHAHGAWLHVDGAFGLWAAAVPELQRSRARASSAPTRGRPTRTSGSTCRTTPASSSSRIRRRIARR